MIEMSAEFWCELVASLAVAAAWFVAFSFALRQREIKGNQVAPPEEGAHVPESDALEFLRETVRLAEERLKAQDDQARALERKAILMGALCVFTVAFMLSWDFDAPGAFLFNLIAVVCLVVSATLCARTVDVYAYGRPGFYAPGQIFQYVQDPRPGYLAYLFRVALGEHYASIAHNEKVNGQKADDLILARRWWIVGTSAALGALGGNSAAVGWACGWLIG